MNDFQHVFNAVQEPFLVIGRTRGEAWQSLEANRAWEQTFGRPRGDYLGVPIRAIFPPDLAESLVTACDQCSAAGETVEIHARLPFAALPTLQCWRLSPVAEPNSPVERIVLQIRPEAHDAKEDSLRYRSILEHAADYISYYDTSGRYLFINRALREFLGVSEAAALGKKSTEVWPNNPNSARTSALLRDIVRTGEAKDSEFFVEVPDRAPIWHQIRFVAERDARGNVTAVVATGRDLSALKIAEGRLRQSEQHFRTLSEHSPDYILRYDRTLQLVYANPAGESYVGKMLSTDRTDMHPGGSFALPAQQPSEAMNELRDAVNRVLDEGRPMELALQDGELHLSFTLVPERTTSDHIETVLAIGRDVTRLKKVEAELRIINATLEERITARTRDLEHANRDLNSFAFTVSHDLRAPLRAILGFTALLKEDEADALSANAHMLIDRVGASASKLDRLIDEVLAYSRAGQVTFKRQPVDLAAVAREIVAELLILHSQARVDIGELPLISGDPTMLRQVLQNLIGNALKFSAHQKSPRVELNYEQRDGEIVFYVRDNGVGFDMRRAENLGILFQRFHSEREFQGSGVGLAIVQRLVERHGGRLWAKSESGAGATFYFTLPSSDIDSRALSVVTMDDDFNAFTRQNMSDGTANAG